MMQLPECLLQIPIAHRGLHNRDNGVIENSVSAVREAVKLGYGVELDLQLSADGEAIVFHDDDLDRLTESSGPVHRKTTAELTAIALLGSTDTPMTLQKIMDEIAGQVPVLLELKNQKDRDTGALEHSTAQVLKTYKGPVAVMSFNPRMVARLAELLPEIPRGLTTGSFEGEGLPEAIKDHLHAISDFDAVGACFVSHEASELEAPRVAELKRAGYPILTWTIRSEASEKEVRKIADNITFEGYLAAKP